MSITDATTSLSTAWTEQSVVDFTSGVLSTISDCVGEVEAFLKRGTLSGTSAPTLTEVKNWIKRAKLKIAGLKSYTFNRKYATATLTAGTYRYALPADYNGGKSVLRDTSNNTPIILWPNEYFDMKFPDPSEESNGDIAVATIKNMELWVMPPPAAADTIEFEYYRSGAETSADDMSWLPEEDRFLCCDYAKWQGFLSLHMWNEANLFKDQWYQGLKEDRIADGRRKWRTMRFQCLNVFQERTLRLNQP